MRMPQIGLGTWQLTGCEAQVAIPAAVNCGYRLIDTAAAYGNETAIKKAILLSGAVREDLIITNKLWNTKRKYDDAIVACKQSLKRMGLDYFDLYLVHWPASPALFENWTEINAECWRAMESLQHDGLAVDIGVCNFLPYHLDKLMETASVVPVVNQFELHPGFYNADAIRYCRERNIAVQAWGPLGEGSLLLNKMLALISLKYNKTTAQICLRWCMQHDAVPLPKSANPEHIRQNIEVFDFKLLDDDMTAIDAMPFSGGAGFDPDTITIFQ